MLIQQLIQELLGHLHLLIIHELPLWCSCMCLVFTK